MVIKGNYYNNINVNKVPENRSINSQQNVKSMQGNFGAILQEKVNQASGIKFSKHAELRLQSRGIKLSAAQLEKINEAVNKADKKGVKDSLVLMDDIALVVNVKNRTVITVANSNELKDNVFTNIDGAVIA